MPLFFFSPDGRISVEAVSRPLRSMKSNMASKRPRSLTNASKEPPSTMICSTRCRFFSQIRKLSPPTAAVIGLTGPVIPSTFDTPSTESPAKSTKKDKNVLSGLGLLQLLPSLLQGRSDPPPRPQVLLEGAVRSALSAHRIQLSLFDVSQLRTTLRGAGQVISWRTSRGITSAQEAFHERSSQHGLGLHQLGFQRAALRLQSADLPAQVIAGLKHVSVLS